MEDWRLVRVGFNGFNAETLSEAYRELSNEQGTF